MTQLAHPLRSIPSNKTHMRNHVATEKRSPTVCALHQASSWCPQPIDAPNTSMVPHVPCPSRGLNAHATLSLCTHVPFSIVRAAQKWLNTISGTDFLDDSLLGLLSFFVLLSLLSLLSLLLVLFRLSVSGVFETVLSCRSLTLP